MTIHSIIPIHKNHSPINIIDIDHVGQIDKYAYFTYR